jgi:plastocyanin
LSDEIVLGLSRKKSRILVVGAAVAMGFMLIVAGTLSLSSAQTQEQGQQQQQTDSAAAQNDITTTTVDAGGGGPESVVTWFTPQNVIINAGETVIWRNPTIVGEPHTVTFIRQEDYFANPQSPYLIANGTELIPANLEEKNTEPLIIPGQNDTANNIIVATNARSSNPVLIDAQNNMTYLPANANYTMTGDELFVNSGWIWPQDQIPPDLPPITSFSVTFENAGTYDYLCIIHPWMAGQVVVQ